MGLKYNLEELHTSLSKLDNVVRNRISNEALREGAKPLERNMKETIRELNEDTGKLRKSIKIGRIKTTKKGKKILVGISEEKYEQCKYGFFQHYGTSRGVVGTRWAEVSFYESIDECDLVITKRIQAELMKVGR